MFVSLSKKITTFQDNLRVGGVKDQNMKMKILAALTKEIEKAHPNVKTAGFEAHHVAKLVARTSDSTSKTLGKYQSFAVTNPADGKITYVYIDEPNGLWISSWAPETEAAINDVSSLIMGVVNGDTRTISRLEANDN
ncbi:MAG: hypothetical protein JRM72_01720 [Nitrososphaerota archaeon]|nr:hypothetical protein [Nitrososphaerota archaeon]